MPSPDRWSAGMLLCWVITRDKNAVLAMLDQHAGLLVDSDTASLTTPPTWDEVSAAYSAGPSPSAADQDAEDAHTASRRVTAAKAQIYKVLESGPLDAQARRNGSGDVERIDGTQWRGLRLRSSDGHDFATPIDVRQQPLHLVRALSAYLSGMVPAAETPTVWVDPDFSAEWAMTIWPAADSDGLESRRPRAATYVRQLRGDLRAGQKTGSTLEQETNEPVIDGTGAPGRPSKSMHLIEPEFDRRCDSDTCELSLAQEAKALLGWLIKNHPSAPRPTAKTIENNIRTSYKRWKTESIIPRQKV